jgi:hypothetical protein
MTGDDVGMPFPNLEGKHAGRAFVTPRRLLEHRALQGRAVGMAPRMVVLGWQASLEKVVRERRVHREVPSPAGVLVVLPSGLGFAPAADRGARRRDRRRGAGCARGGSGRRRGHRRALGDGLAPGDLVVCSGALRDEGTSHHYAPPDRFARRAFDPATVQVTWRQAG